MKSLFENYIVPVLIVIALVMFIGGFKLPNIANFIHTEKKRIIDNKKQVIEDKLDSINTSIDIEKSKIYVNTSKINKLEEKKIKFNKEVDNAKSDLDKLDVMFSDFL